VAASLGGGGEGGVGVGVGVVGVDPISSNNNAVIGIMVGGLTPGGGVGGARGVPPPSSSSSRQQRGAGQRPPPSPGRDAPSGGGGRTPSSSSRRAFGYDDDDDDERGGGGGGGGGGGPTSQSRSYSPDVVRLKSSLYTADDGNVDSNDNSSSVDLLDQIASSATHDDDNDYPPFGGDDDDDDDYGGSDYYGGSDQDRESDDSDHAAGRGGASGRRGGGGKKAPHSKSSRVNKLGKSKIARISRSADHLHLPRRYRGFSTSLSSLFLDESIVCGAVSCWGLLLSSRTEHLLDERNLITGPESMASLMQLVGIDPVTGAKSSSGSVAGYSFGGTFKDPFNVTSQAKEIQRQVIEQVENIAKASGGVITDGDRAGALQRIRGSGTVGELQNALVDFYGKYASKARAIASTDPQAFQIIAKTNPALAAVFNFGQARQAATAAGFRTGAK
jgi:hypothetical protein